MTHLIPLPSIKIAPNRQRKEFDINSLNELKDSIEKNGLLQAPVLRRKDGEYYLVAGERRLRAISDIYELGGRIRYGRDILDEGMIPFLDMGELNDLDKEEAELEENIRRVDLSWQEKAAATSRLMSLRQKQSAAKGIEAPTPATIAVEVRGKAEPHQVKQTRLELAVAKHIDRPEIKAAKSLDDAFKFLKKEEETKKNVETAQRVGLVHNASLHSLHNADANVWLQGCVSNTFDVILTDPPFGMGADTFGDAAGKIGGTGHIYTDDVETFDLCLNTIATEGYRVTKDQAHLYMFCDLDKYFRARSVLSAAGWWVHRTPIIWAKTNGSRVPWPEHGPRRSYEVILYALKGKKPVNVIARDVIVCDSDDNMGHAAQKPVFLLTDLLKRSVRPGNLILDPFMGTGSTIEAANSLQCIATGIELDPSYYGIAVTRVEVLKDQLSLEV